MDPRYKTLRQPDSAVRPSGTHRPVGTIRIAIEALIHLNAADGWALASHIALSTLMSLFPFLIFVTALGGFFGSKELADEVARILLDTWPVEVAAPIARELHNVLTTARGGVLTVGVVLALYFASSGIESLRIALNRAYSVTETRPWWLLRLESIGYVLLGAAALLVLAFMVVLGPLMVATAMRYLPWLAPFEHILTLARFGITSGVLVLALVLVHLWLPAGRRRLRDIWLGVAVTIILWLIGGALFGRYLAEFANNYITTYAGLASAMIALVFLYWTASIFIYGGELNAAMLHRRSKKESQQAFAAKRERQ